MFVSRSINADHKDLIHDVAYDFYGRRMATCSSDQNVKVWDMTDDGQWHCTANWKTHSGSVWKVTWAHPEFGQVIATCSFDRTAAVWEEIVGDGGVGGQERGQSHWVKRTSLVDSRTSVTDVRFAPRHMGLQLATSSSDGIVRVYEAPDVMNLNQWSLQHEISCKLSCSCVVWSPSKIHAPMLAIGSDDNAAGGKVFIYEYSDNTRRWNRVETIMSVSDPVHDLAFAPNLGRSFHMLAVASKDVGIIVIKPVKREASAGASASSSQSNSSLFDISLLGQFDEHNSTVWRVSWNITGTILASSGDDGCVRLWKANHLQVWKCISCIKGDATGPMSDAVVGPHPAGAAAKH